MGEVRGQLCLLAIRATYNLCMMISVIAVISVGATVLTIYHKYEPILDDAFFSIPTLLIVTGSIIPIVSYFGCYFAVMENRYKAITFLTLLVIIFIMELAAGIAGYVLRNHVEEMLEERMSSTILDYAANNTENTALWDGIQHEFKCCGVHNYSSWNELLPNKRLPNSCCFDKSGDIGRMNCSSLDTHNVYKRGCIEEMSQLFVNNAVALGGVGIGIAVLQLFVIGINWCLASFHWIF